MQREIKFRAKQIKDNQWVYGVPTKSTNGKWYMTHVAEAQQKLVKEVKKLKRKYCSYCEYFISNDCDGAQECENRDGYHKAIDDVLELLK
jgi:lipopolysaccharide biosynthesis regulator YciM